MITHRVCEIEPKGIDSKLHTLSWLREASGLEMIQLLDGVVVIVFAFTIRTILSVAIFAIAVSYPSSPYRLPRQHRAQKAQ